MLGIILGSAVLLTACMTTIIVLEERRTRPVLAAARAFEVWRPDPPAPDSPALPPPRPPVVADDSAGTHATGDDSWAPSDDGSAWEVRSVPRHPGDLTIGSPVHAPAAADLPAAGADSTVAHDSAGPFGNLPIQLWDSPARFLAHLLRGGAAGEVAWPEIWSAYERWAETTGEDTERQDYLAIRLTRLGVVKIGLREVAGGPMMACGRRKRAYHYRLPAMPVRPVTVPAESEAIDTRLAA